MTRTPPAARLCSTVLERLVDQVGAVIERLDRHARRQALLAARSISSLTRSTTSRPFWPISIITSPVTISPWPSRVARPARIIGAGWTLATSRDRDRHAVALVDDDRRDVVDAAHLAHAADVPRLALVDEVAAADVGVVRPQRVEEVGHRQPVGRQLVGIELDLVRLQLAAVRVDLGDARRRRATGRRRTSRGASAAPSA